MPFLKTDWQDVFAENLSRCVESDIAVIRLKSSAQSFSRRGNHDFAAWLLGAVDHLVMDYALSRTQAAEMVLSALARTHIPAIPARDLVDEALWEAGWSELNAWRDAVICVPRLSWRSAFFGVLGTIWFGCLARVRHFHAHHCPICPRH